MDGNAARGTIGALGIVVSLLGSACIGSPPAVGSLSPAATATASATPSASASSSEAASPTPSGSPTPSPVASGPFAGYIFVPNATGAPPDDFTRYGGTLVDAASGDPIVGACVYTGPPVGCPLKGAIQTDDSGAFAIDLPSGSDWEFTFERSDYDPLVQAKLERRTDNTIQLVRKP